jgi:hypothetical protein
MKGGKLTPASWRDTIEDVTVGSEIMKAGLLERLIQEIRQIAFPVVLEVGQVFKQVGYKHYFKHHYTDKADSSDRDIDLLATKGHLYGASNSPIYLIDMFYVEVEKATSPWIVFTSEKSDTDHESPEAFAFDGLSPGFVAALNSFAQTRQLAEHARIGRACHIASDEVFAPAHNGRSVVSAPSTPPANAGPMPAMLACARASMNIRLARPRTAWDNTATMWSVTKLVIVDGPLYEAQLRGHDIDLAEASHIPFILNMSSSERAPFSFVVHIVRHKYFPDFLKHHQKWSEQLGEEIRRRIGG